MFLALSRRKFLSGSAALAVAACSSPVSGTVLGHTVRGDGDETVLVLHEWLGDHTNYDPAWHYLSPGRARYVFADLRGYGLSRNLAGSYSLDEAADDALTLMDRLGCQRFHAVGHSMCGMLAQYLLVRAPHRLKSVVTISPVPAAGFKTDAAGLAKLEKVITDDEALRVAVTSRTGGRYGQGWLDRKLTMARRADPAAMRGYMHMFCDNDFTDRVAGADVPVTLITGAQDIAFYTQPVLEPQFRRLYPRLRTAVITDAGHYSMLEAPILLASLVEHAVFQEPLNSDT